MNEQELSSEVVAQATNDAARLSANAFRLVLGSRSPRRRQLLTEQGYQFEILPSQDGIEENAEQNELREATPVEFVAGLAYIKAQNVIARLNAADGLERGELAQKFLQQGIPNDKPFVVVSCDSVAVCKDRILGKPDDRADAERMLRLLSGSRHAVHTGLCVWLTDPSGKTSDKIVRRVETSILQMEILDDDRLSSYLDGGKWEGKAGAFGYQDGNDWLTLVSGTASNVVGLPVETLGIVLTDILTSANFS